MGLALACARRAFLRKKALHDSHVITLKLYPLALSPHTLQACSIGSTCSALGVVVASGACSAGDSALADTRAVPTLLYPLLRVRRTAWRSTDSSTARVAE